MRIAVVNDSDMARQALAQVIEQSGRYRLAWTAADGREALAHCRSDRPDVLLMDLIMPGMDGVETTRRIMAEAPCAILVVTADVSGQAGRVFEAMGAGALDAVNTPVLGIDGAGGKELLAKLDTVARLVRASGHPGCGGEPATPRPDGTAGQAGENPLIAIGASTGGPAALRRLLSLLPPDLPAAITVVQHVDAEFARSFAQWLDKELEISVTAARPGEKPVPGRAYIAIEDRHLRLDPRGRFEYRDEPRDCPYRPAVDVFFHSVATHWRGQAVGVLLTGMGKDGAEGLLAMRRAGCLTIAQDAATSAIFGMPKAAIHLDAASRVLPLDAIAPALVEAIRAPRRQKTVNS